MSKIKIFLATSFTKKQKVENAIKNFFENKGFEVITGRLCRSGMPIDKEIKRLIEDCEFGVVVYNELRHNISYEWGLLDSLGKKVFLLKDENVHIDLDIELSDKKGTTFTPFYGEDSGDEIIKSLESNEGLMSAIRGFVAKRISGDETEGSKQAAELLVKSNIPLTGIKKEGDVKIDNLKEIIEYLKRVKKLTAEGRYNKATAYYYAKNYKKAEEELREAIRINPNYAEAHNNLGILLTELKRYDEAEEEYRKAIKINPKLAEAHNNLGFLLAELKRYEEAEKEYRKAIKINPKPADAHYNLGILLAELKRYEEAEEEYRKAIMINPKLAEAHNNLGILLAELKRYEEAEEEYRKAIMINPNYADAHYNLGILLAELKRYDEAEEEFREAIKINPEDLEAHNGLGNLLVELKRYDEAEKEYRGVMKTNPKEANANYNLACLYSIKRDLENSIKYLKKVIQLDDEYKEKAKEDNDFINIRDTKEFKEIVGS
jgi:tetratricopeptide (TPR) repeat protein